MAPKSLPPAIDMVHRMETRIEQQNAEIERLKQANQDISDPTRRLWLLQAALVEMRLHLGQLSPTIMDRKRPDVGVPQTILPRKK